MQKSLPSAATIRWPSTWIKSRSESAAGAFPGSHAIKAITHAQIVTCSPRRSPGEGGSLLILLVTDFLHPLDGFAVERFLNSDMRHRSRRRGPVPMLLVRRKPDDIARPDFLD